MSAEPEAPLDPGSVRAIAHYNLLQRMGEGALGEVYRARDTKFGRTVAIKLVPDSLFTDATSLGYFEQDARAAATLSHPNIATLFDVGQYDGGWYLAYEFAAGVTLREETAGGAVSPRRAVELAVQIADALADAHARGVLHGDLRPDSIFVTKKGSAKILEFGMGHWTHGGQTRIRAATPAGVDRREHLDDGQLHVSRAGWRWHGGRPYGCLFARGHPLRNAQRA